VEHERPDTSTKEKLIGRTNLSKFVFATKLKKLIPAGAAFFWSETANLALSIRYRDKLIDELAQGKTLEKILRKA